MRIGVLLPSSTMIPLVGFDFLDGIRACIANQQLQDKIEIFSSPAGFGTQDRDIYSRVEFFLLQDKADIVVGFIEYRLAELLQPLFTSTGKILILVNPGANCPENWSAPSPNILYHSLNFSFLAHLTGQLPVNDGYPQAIVATSYYDGGYYQCQSIVNSHLLAKGEVTGNYISPLKLAELNIAPLEQLVLEKATLNPCLFCLFSGDYAKWFLPAAGHSDVLKNIPLYVSPTLLSSETNGGNMPGSLLVKGYTVWFPELDNDPNRIFREAFTQLSGRQPGLIGLLGWETALLLLEVFSRSAAREGPELINQLKEKVFESPRGWFKIDPVTHHSYSPVYLLVKDKDGETIVNSKMEDPGKEWKEFITQPVVPGLSSGWKNTYLCI